MILYQLVESLKQTPRQIANGFTMRQLSEYMAYQEIMQDEREIAEEEQRERLTEFLGGLG